MSGMPVETPSDFKFSNMSNINMSNLTQIVNKYKSSRKMDNLVTMRINY